MMTELNMGWLWLVGSIQLYVPFAKEPYKRDYILQKRPIISSILLTVATPYHMRMPHMNACMLHMNALHHTGVHVTRHTCVVTYVLAHKYDTSHIWLHSYHTRECVFHM